MSGKGIFKYLSVSKSSIFYTAFNMIVGPFKILQKGYYRLFLGCWILFPFLISILIFAMASIFVNKYSVNNSEEKALGWFIFLLIIYYPIARIILWIWNGFNRPISFEEKIIILKRHGLEGSLLTEKAPLVKNRNLTRIVNIDPEIMSGTPIFTGTRVPIKALFDYIETGKTIDDFFKDFSSVKHSQVSTLLETAHQLLLSETK